MTDAPSPSAPTVLTADRIEAAAATLGPRVRTTPLLTVDGAELGVAGRVSLKLEFLQHSGTFKGRGALHFLLTNPIAEAGVTAASGGNHGVAVAWAAAQLGHRATIFVPTISAPAKVARLRSLGAEVVQTGRVYADALAACRDHEAATGATSIHAYDAIDVMAGAGTTGRELEAQVAAAGLPPLDAVLVSCGGGGLSGGVAGWFGDRTTVVACETPGTRAWAAARAAGRPVDVEVEGVAADALGATRLGQLAFDTLRATGAETVVVPDDDVITARQFLWDRFRMAVEAAAAVPVAALTTAAWTPGGPAKTTATAEIIATAETTATAENIATAGSHVAVIVCGANTSPGDLDRGAETQE